MHVVYTGQEAPKVVTKSIFLAGPSPRKDTDPNWRPEAFDILKRLGYDGVVYAPIWPDGPQPKERFDYEGQVDWETRYLNQADVVLFWVPRDIDGEVYALTTNVEFGLWATSGKVVFGAPPTADKNEYLKHHAGQEGVPVFDTLEDTLAEAVKRLGNGLVRIGGEREVPLFVWHKPEFRTWYENQKNVGNRLDGAKVVWSFRVGKNKERSFLCALHVNVYIKAEDRNKVNEIVIFRPDISAIVAYCRPDRSTFQYDKTRPLAFMQDTEVVIVQEFRSPVNNVMAMVNEVPGGSSLKPGVNPSIVASEEMHEETGMQLAASRFRYIGARQIAATLCAHRAHVFAVEMTAAEMLSLKWDKGTPHGNHEDSEYTFVEVVTVGELMSGEVVDWSNMGMILTVLLGE